MDDKAFPLPPLPILLYPQRIRIAQKSDGGDTHWRVVVTAPGNDRYLLYIVWTNPDHRMTGVAVRDFLGVGTPKPASVEQWPTLAVPVGCGGNAIWDFRPLSPALSNGWFRTIQCQDSDTALQYLRYLVSKMPYAKTGSLPPGEVDWVQE